MTYYIDTISGKSDSDGTCEACPRLTYHDLSLEAGDKVLFKRGNFIRAALKTIGGTAGKPVTYGAFGEGDKPVFCGSVDISGPGNWAQVRPNLWECHHPLDTEACNLIFNHGEACGTLRWTSEELIGQGDFWDSRFGLGEKRIGAEIKPSLLVYSDINPGEYYTQIECAVFGSRCMATLKSHLILEDLAFCNSGVHGCAGAGSDIRIQRCDFAFIGGCVWNKDLKIRFGNGVEFWNIAEDVTVEQCSFNNIYDSCVTHQGSRECKPAVNAIFSHNLFMNYGMAAYECRDLNPIATCFNDNICIGAGEGFSKLGEVMPRRSEIWPQPMGHHIFLWRIPKATENGGLEIKRNIFYNAPYGAAIYSIISPEAEDQLTIDENRYYTENETLFNRFGGRDFSDFESYVQATGRDRHGSADPMAIDPILEKWRSK